LDEVHVKTGLRKLQRREFLVMSSVATVAATTVSCSRRPADSFRFFSTGQARTVEAICEQIIPADQNPGAGDAGVVYYIDLQLTRHFKRHRRAYVEGIAAVDAAAGARYGSAFAALDFSRQTEVLKDIEKNEKAFFDLILSHTLQGFFGDPRHGGNRDMVGWKMLGIPNPPVRGRIRIEPGAGETA
jgi:gluconate 2-dehydrogenase gamma chain